MPVKGGRSWFELPLAMMTFGRAQMITYKDYDPTAMQEHLDIDANRIDISRYARDRGSTIPILTERLAILAAPEPSGTFLVITPNGPPGRYNQIMFVDTHLFPPEYYSELNNDP